MINETVEVANSVSEVNSLKLYFKDVGRFRPTDRDKERQLIKSAQDGDIKSRNELVRSNLRFVVSIAKKHQHLGIDLEDLIQAGNIGLIEAVEQFNLEQFKDFRFLTYAVHHIRKSIIQSLLKQRRTVRLPAHRQKDEFQTVSLDQPVGENGESNGTTLLDIFVFDSGEVVSKADREQLQRGIETLTKREQKVINMLFGLGYDREYTLEEVGDIFNVTGNRIRGIRRKALEKLQKQFVA